VRTQTIRTRLKDGPHRAMSELHRFGGSVHDGAGAAIAGAWVVFPEAGRWAASDSEGRFRLAPVPAGTHRVVVRTIAGDEAEATVSVPGAPADLVVGKRTRPKR
jgi:hypothetical protein